jgi:F-type H+-transporting ATPase subunit epsilon
MATPFHCRIVTPADAVFDAPVTYVSFPAWDGQQGVLAGQSPLLSRLGIGRCTIEAEGGNSTFHVDGGFAQVQDNTLTLLTERATPLSELSARDAEKELAEANRRVTESGVDRAAVEAQQARARTKLAMARG